MHNLKRMKDSHSHNHLLTNLGSIIFLKIVVVFDEFVEIFALDKLSDDVDMGLGLDHFFKLEEQRMRNGLHDAALMSE